MSRSAIRNSSSIITASRPTAGCCSAAARPIRARPPRDIAGFVRPHMLKVFPQLAGKRIDYAWGGQLAITMGRLPHFGRLPGDIFFAQGYSGQGLALAIACRQADRRGRRRQRRALRPLRPTAPAPLPRRHAAAPARSGARHAVVRAARSALAISAASTSVIPAKAASAASRSHSVHCRRKSESTGRMRRSLPHAPGPAFAGVTGERERLAPR